MPMFEVDLAGLRELEGGREPWRFAFEPLANVFDEARGYVEGRARPTWCAITIEWQSNPRGVLLRIEDDGAGFDNPADIYTLFGTTAKRSEPGVAGRFNAGEKQLIAAARCATVVTVPERSAGTTVTFPIDGDERTIVHHRVPPRPRGTMVEALMPWSKAEAEAVRQALMMVLPPRGLRLTVDGVEVSGLTVEATVRVTLPTVALIEGVLRGTERKTLVDVFNPLMGEPWLYELGIPVCSLVESEFRHSLNVLQKVPVPMSRDSVTPAYLHRLIGTVIEAAALDGKMLLGAEDDGAAHLKRSLDYVKRPEALRATVHAVYGEQAVRSSSDAMSNAVAAAQGRPVVSGRQFGTETRKRLEQDGLLPTAHAVYGDRASSTPSTDSPVGEVRCPHCHESFKL